jgi:hypothetical protein
MASEDGVLFVGSVPLNNSEAVFRMLADRVGALASRYPDGETGMRTNWIRWQRHIFDDNDAFELVQSTNLAGIKDTLDRPFFRVRPSVDDAAVKYKPLGFAEEAIKSFSIFSRLKRDGIIPPATRFQVSLPTAVAILSGFVVMEDRAKAEPALEIAMAREVTAIAEAIPHEQLAVQWDFCLELVGYDGGYKLHFKDILPDSVDRLERLIASVPTAAEIGVHLCYGDPGHKHLVEPADASSCVRFSNEIAARVDRPLNWVHIPIPRGWMGPKPYQPLSDLKLPQESKIYLGLLHFTDGREGAERRVSIARQYVSHFGVATECGFGRRDASTVSPLLDLHREIAEMLA